MISSERLKGIDVFVATADAGSFTAAAQRLNLTNSAVGKAVARLEGRLNARLFERTTRSLKMTEAGEAFYQVCMRVLLELETAEQVLATQTLQPSGRLRIDVPATFGRSKVLPLLLSFAAQYPAVQPHVSFTDRFVDVLNEGIDVAVRIGGPDVWPDGLGHSFLCREQLVFCAAPAYLSRRGVPATVADLFGHDAVLYGSADGSVGAWRIATRPGATERRPVEGKIVMGNAEAQVSAVLAGCGIAQLATWLVDAQLRDGTLLRILPGTEVDGLPLNLVWPRSRQLAPKVARLLAHLEQGLSLRAAAP
jgi:DNA-binding transcriptional LysR family regulator